MNHKTEDELTAFEDRIRDIFAFGDLPFLIHLAGGNEQQLVDIFQNVKPGDWILGSHRSHLHALLAGLSEEWLEKEIREGRSMFLFSKAHNFLTSAILAGTCGIAAGIAWALREEKSENSVWCFLGDGASDEGHFYEALMFVEGHNLPCTFVIEDNDRSVDTNKADRRGIFGHLPFERFINSPHVIRYQYTPTYPHGGAGLKQMIQFNPEIVAKYANPT